MQHRLRGARRSTVGNAPRQTVVSVAAPGPSGSIALREVGTSAASILALQRAVGNRAVARLVAAYAGNGSGRSITLHGQTEPHYDGGTGTISNVRTNRATSCTCDDGPCYQVTGLLTVTYTASPVISMPEVPGGLTPCQQRRVRAFLRDVLGPHEREHARRIRTYSGTTKRAFAAKGCGRDGATAAAQDQAQEMHDTEADQRATGADALSLAIDPFTRRIDLDCKD